MRLVIGNKNYSSWSMRAGVLMHELGIAFEEHKLRLDFAEGSPFRAALARFTPAGRVPVLVLDDGLAVWDTLAITETLHERFPDRGVWPADAAARARARSLCAEMHAGFAALREHCPMNIEAALPDAGARVWAEQPGVRRDVQRLEQAWGDALAASGGPMLFGAFSAADAFFAPVCMRLVTYALPVSDTTRAYVERLTARPGVASWIADARAEKDFIADDEPYRSSR
jgi:glutathione S-transferase